MCIQCFSDAQQRNSKEVGKQKLSTEENNKQLANERRGKEKWTSQFSSGPDTAT